LIETIVVPLTKRCIKIQFVCDPFIMSIYLRVVCAYMCVRGQYLYVWMRKNFIY